MLAPVRQCLQRAGESVAPPVGGSGRQEQKGNQPALGLCALTPPLGIQGATLGEQMGGRRGGRGMEGRGWRWGGPSLMAWAGEDRVGGWRC